MLGDSQRPGRDHLTSALAHNGSTEYSPALGRNNLYVTFGLAFRLGAVIFTVRPAQNADGAVS